ncbi:exodeoxyribonuclease VII large subunit [Prevotellaceae bacterium HUN156]|nr:exodeoxyribonuclease VII large subunit [Prevotellaceae bacterium HUN156]
MIHQRFTLRQLNMMVHDAIEMQLSDEYWVEAELSECRERSGHCYMELIEKDEQTNTPIARASAKCWRQTWQMVQPHFEHITGQPLHAGLKVLLRVYAQFHETFGFSWIVTDIDPTYTIGDMARRRQEIIRQLKEEGVFDLQRELQLPLFTQRIAVISAKGAAGYGDFCRQLEENEYGFKFQVTLFPAVMQGEQVEHSLIAALEKIYDYQFDCVVIIRGGGATADLSGFDTLALAENVAQFPLPIITGIGHDRDESILDMVSHTRVKTPTAAATLLIDRLASIWQRLENAQQRIRMVQRLFSEQHHHLDLLQNRLSIAIERIMTHQKHRVSQLELQLQSFDPQILLGRGYSITLHNGRAVRNPQELKPGDEIETRVEKGVIISTVKQ